MTAGFRRERPRRAWPAALLAAPLLFAAAPAAAHHTLELSLSKTSITEGESVTVTARCTANCGLLSFGGGNNYLYSSAYVDIAITSATGVSLSDPARLTFNVGPGNLNLGTATGTVTISTEDDAVYSGNREVTVSATVPWLNTHPTEFNKNSFWWYLHSNPRREPTRNSPVLTVQENDPRRELRVVETGGTTVVTEAGGTDTFTVSASHEPTGGGSISAQVTTADSDECQVSVDGGATYSSDQTLTLVADGASTSATSSEWDEGHTVTVRGVDDGTTDGDAACRISIDPSGGGYDSAATETVQATNLDDDAGPTAMLSVSPTSIAEGGTATVSATLSRASTGNVTVTVHNVAGVYTADAADQTITIMAGQTSNATDTVTITAGTDDDIDEPDQNVLVTGSAAASGGATVGSTAGAALAITDNDATPTVTLSVAAATIKESSGTASETMTTVTATLSGASSEATTVTVTPSAGEYTVESDAVIEIAAGMTTDAETVTITAVDNNVDERDRRVTVTGTAENDHAVGAVTGAALTITDDEMLSAGLTLSKNSVTTREGGAMTDSFTVRLTGEPTATVTVGVALTGSNTDEATVSPSSLTFTTSDWDVPRTVTVTGVDDSLRDADQAYTITLDPSSPGTSGDSNYDGLASSTVSGTNVDNDSCSATNPCATLTLSASTIYEQAGHATRQAALRAELSHNAPAEVRIRVSATPSTNAAADDYTLTGNTLVIQAGSKRSTGTVPITAVDDNVDSLAVLDAPNPLPMTTGANLTGKLVVISGSVTAGAALAPSSVNLVINDDDQAGLTYTPAPPSGRIPRYCRTNPSLPECTSTYLSVKETGSAAETAKTFQVKLKTEPTANVSVRIYVREEGVGEGKVSKAGAAPADSTTLTFTPQNWNANQTVTLTGVDDREVDGDVDYQLGVDPSGAATDAYSLVQTDRLQVRTEDTSMAPTLVLTPNPIDETDQDPGSADTSTATVTATLENAVSSVVTVTVSAAPGTNAAAGDFALSANKTLTIAAGDTSSTGTAVTIAAVNNDVDEADKQVTVSATTSGGGLADPQSATLTIRDDDTAALALSRTSGLQTDEGGGTDTFTVALATEPTATVTVEISSSDAGEAAVSPANLKFGATADSGNSIFQWDDPQTVTVTGEQDTAPDGDQSYTVRVSSTSTDSNYSGLARDVSGTNADDDAATVMLELSPASISESGGTSQVSATLSQALGAPVTVTVTALAGAYSVPSSANTITIAAGDTTSAGRVTITALGNTTDEPNRMVKVSATAATTDPLGVAASAEADLTLEDDDAAPTVTLTAAGAIKENSNTQSETMTTVSAALSHPSSEATTITLTAASGAAYSVGADATITIAAGDTTASGDTASVAAVDNATDAPDRTVTVTATAVNSHGAGTVTGAELTIEDDDAAPTVTLTASPGTIKESSGTTSETMAAVSAALSHPSSEATTITVTPSAGEYTVGTDATITIAAGQTMNASDTASITAVNNSLDEDDRSVTVTGTAANSHGAGAVTGASLTIEDDDAEPSLSIDSPSAAESSDLEFTVTLSAASGKQVTVNYALDTTDDGTATSGTDYTSASASGSLTFAAGETTQPITVTVTDDTTDEADETVRLTLSGAMNASIGTATGVGTIQDNDAAPTVTLALSPAAVDEEDQDSGAPDTRVSTVTASLNHASSEAITVTVAATAVLPATSANFTLSLTTTLTIAAGSLNSTGAVTVTATGNTMSDGDKRVTVSGTVSGGVSGSASANPSPVTLTIRDDDAPTLSLVLGATTIAESGAGNSTTITASLNRASTAVTTITLTEPAGTTLSGTTLTIDANETSSATAATTAHQSVTITAVDNTRDEVDQMVEVTGATTNTGVSGPAAVTLTITDDDAQPSLSIGNASVTEGNSGSASLTFTVTLSAASGRQVTVDYAPDSTDDGTATSGTDYTASSASGTLTINAGATSGTITVSVTGDTLDEANETVRLTLSNASSASISTATGVGTIMDDDALPSLSINSPSRAESADLVFTVTLSPASGRQVTVDYALDGTPGTATSGTDYTALPASPSLTFNAGETTKTITVAVTDDALDEANETVRVTLSNAGNASLGTATGTGTITDDDATPTLSIANASVAEGNSGSANLNFTVTLSAASGRTVTVGYAPDSTDAGTATSGTDYTASSASGTLTINAGAMSGTITVSVTGDTLDEANETVRVTLSNPGNATIAAGMGTATGTITDDDALPSLSIDSPSRAESANLVFTVTLSPASGRQVTVDYALDGTPGTATSGTDYTALPASPSLTFNAGETTKTITVTVTDDALNEADETVRVTLSGATNASLGTATGVGTITNNDAQPSLSIDSPSRAESMNLAFTVTLSAASGRQVTVNYALDTTDSGTATSGTDYAALAAGTLTFAANETTKTITVTVTDDALDEADETVRVTLSGATNANISTATGVGTITDNDGAPSLSIADTSVPEGDSGSASLTFTVTLSPASGQTVTVGYAVAAADAGTATAGTDYAAVTPGTLTFNAGTTSQTITVSVTGDTQDEPDETVKVTLSGANNAGIGTAVGTGTITDDDGTPTAALSVSPPSIAENGGTSRVSATLSNASSAATTVTVTAAAGYTVPAAPNNAITIAAGALAGSGTVTITAVDNSVDAPADNVVTVTGTAANSQGVAAAATGAALTITDDDVAGLTLSKTSVATSEDGAPQGRDSFGVSLATRPLGSATVSVSIAVTGGDTDEATVSPQSLQFAAAASGSGMNQVFAWNDGRTVTVTGEDDPDLDGIRNYEITVSTTSSAAQYNNLSRTVAGTNRDNEAPTVTLELSSATVAEGGSVTVTANLDRTVAEATTIALTASAGADAPAGIFQLSATTLTVPAGETESAAATITAVDDEVDAPDRTVTLSGTVSGGQGAADPAAVTLAIEDDEAAPAVTLTPAAPEIWESGAGSRTAVSATLSHASSRATTITVRPVAGMYRVVGRAVIVIPAFRTTSEDRVTIEAVDNAETAAQADPVARMTARVENAQGEGPVRAAPLTVLDDETASVELMLEPAAVSEGGTARVSARLTRAISSPVTVTVAAAPGEHATAADFSLGAERVLTIPAGRTAAAGSVSIAAADDAVDAPDRTVEVTAAVASSVRARTPRPALLTIEDDEETPRVALVLTPAAIDERGENNEAAVSARLSGASSEATTITVSASGAGFEQRGTTLTIPARGTESAAAVAIAALDDGEEAADRRVVVSGRAANAHGVEQPADAVLTIRDGDGSDAVTETLLPEAARAMADSLASAVRRRLERAAAAAASELPALTELLERHGQAAQDDALEWKPLLGQSSFALPLEADDGGSPGGLVAWGSGDYRDLDGEARGVKWDGEVASAHLGLDRLLANGLRAGLAASWSQAKFDYAHQGREGEWNLEMTSAQPYLGWTTANGVELWASAGAGSGELEIVSGGSRQESDADMWLAAAGARGPLHETASGLQVSLRGEALYSSFGVDGNGSRIRAYTADVSRLRLALEARRDRVLESGARLSPRFELGVRHDGGDGETGAGVELGGGAEYSSGRLSASGGARALAANSDYDEWGAELALEYAPGADGRGFSFRLAPSWGAAQSGTRELWEQGAPRLNGAADESDPGGRLEAELGYGLKSPWSRGLLTLGLGGELGEDEGAACRLRGAVALDAAATLGLELELRDPKAGATEHSLMLTGELRF